MAVLAMLATCGLCGFADQAPATNDPPKPLPKEIAQAWKEAGAEVGWMRVDNFDFLKLQTEGVPGDLPAFGFSARAFLGFPWEEGLLATLPSPAAAFGLDLGFTPVTDAGLKELAGLKNLQTLNLFRTLVTDAGLKELAPLKDLQTLELAGTLVTDAGLKELAALKNLQRLGLRDTQVNGAGLKELAGLKSLKALNLDMAQVTDAGLKGLAGLKSLQALDLRFTHVTDLGLKELTGLKNLQSLNLENTQVTDAGLKELAGLKSLQTLFLFGYQITDAGLKELAGLKNLQTLYLENTEVTDAGLKELAALKNLQTLYLGNAKVTDAGLKELAGLKNLQTLSLAGTQVTDAGLRELAMLKRLQHLHLHRTNVTDAGPKELTGRKLKTLGISPALMTDVGLKHYLAAIEPPSTLDLNKTNVTDAGLKELAGLKNLRKLSLLLTKVTDAGLKELAGLKNLQELDLGYTFVTDAGLKELAELKSLQTLILYATKVTDAGLKELGGLKRLQELDLRGTKVTDAGLKELAGLKSLQTLSLNGTQVTDAGLMELAGLKNLQTLDLGETMVTEAGLKELAGLKLKSMTLPFVLTDLGLKHYLAAMEPPTRLDLRGTKVTDAGLKELAGLKTLKILDLPTQVTDAGLKELAGLKLKKLTLPFVLTDVALKYYLAAMEPPTSLDLRRTKVTDVGLKELAGRKTLKILALPTRVTDVGLKELAGLKSLQKLDLGGTGVTDAGIEGLQKALPDCKIMPALVNDGEKLFRAMEKKIKAANAVQVTADIEIRAIKGREEESKLKDRVSRANGFLLFTKDNKARLKISGEYVGMEMVSNGKQLKLWGEERDARFDEAKAMPTPNHLHSLVRTAVSRAGVTAGSMIITFAPGPQFTPIFLASGEGAKNDFDHDSLGMSVGAFKPGAATQVGGRDAKVVSYNGSKDPVMLWIDAKTLLPLKCVVIISKENMHITENYTEFKLDPKIDANAFELIPAQGNQAEKLFRAVEEKIKAAKAVEVTFDIETKLKDKGAEGKLKGAVLFTKDNKARLKMSGKVMGKEMTIEMISDGKRMKMAESPATIANAEEARTRTNLHSLLSAMVSGPGLLLADGELSPGPPAPTFRLAHFNAGAAEKVGGRDAKVITYDAIMPGDTCQVTLWIDAKTMLPLKRLIVYEGNQGKQGRITETCNFNLNPTVEAGAFALPK